MSECSTIRTDRRHRRARPDNGSFNYKRKIIFEKKEDHGSFNALDECVACSAMNCLGALDGTHNRVRVLMDDKPKYRTQKSKIATNVLGVCSKDMKFIYVLPCWEDFAVDDARYTNCKRFLASYRGQRYHLNYWEDGNPPKNPQEYFNMKHSSVRNVIERCFGPIKNRWAILRSSSFYPIKTQNRIILACCLLHNFIRRKIPTDNYMLSENEIDSGDEEDVDGSIRSIEASEE
ncbi:protein ALP1-like [Cannabis sativa]|uniref:protein ALP1-like n=1 Tax=Cannabis sativa TaxID=3483 RepID=UPI0029CA446F|nr:protein ALP1-like [Cannabis sativa]